MEFLEDIIYYINKNNPVGALLLKGEWGCGKTYFVEHTLRNAIKDNCILVRISLFGISNIESLNVAVKKAWLNSTSNGFYGKVETAKKYVINIENILSKIPRVKDYVETMGGFLSANLLDFINISPSIDDKKVILV